MEIREKVYYIYKIHFLCGFPTGRYYIGKHYGYTDDHYSGSGEFCRRYFKKYGKTNGITYIKEILEINPDSKINTQRENVIVNDLWKIDPLCMNLKPGGDADHDLSISAKEKLSEINKIPVVQYSLNGEFISEFDSIKTASEQTGICRTKISSCCNKNRLTCGGFIWRHKNDTLIKDEIEFIQKNTKFKSCNERKVIQILSDGTEITYKSIRFASRQTGVSKSSISAVCKGNRKSAGGYKWKYKED